MDHSLKLRLSQIRIWKRIAMGMTKVYFVKRMDYSTSRQEPSTLIWSSDFVMTKILSGPAVSWNWVGALKTSRKLGMQRAFSEWELWEHCHYVRHSNNKMTWWKLNHKYMSIWWIYLSGSMIIVSNIYALICVKNDLICIYMDMHWLCI
jgi:hypothetical protein